MILSQGQVLRFKGRHAQANCDDVERELHGRCKRDGNSLEVTKNTRLKINDDEPTFEIVEQQRNGANVPR
jgi:hypothetical protein